MVDDSLLDRDLYDAIVAYHESDATLVETFIQDLKKDIRISDKEPQVASLSDAMLGSESKYEGLKGAITNSTFLIVFASENYAKNATAYDKFIRDVFFEEALSKRLRFLFPVWVDWQQKDEEKPFGLGTLNGCKYSTTDKKRNKSLWRKLQGDFDEKEHTLRQRRQIRAQRLGHQQQQQRLTGDIKLRRREEEHKNEMERIKRQGERPVPKPRQCNISRPAIIPRESSCTAANPVNILIHVHEGAHAVVIPGEHRPSLPNSSLDESSFSTPSSSSPSERRSSTTSTSTADTAATTDGRNKAISSSNRSSDSSDRTSVPPVVEDVEDHSLNFRMSESFVPQVIEDMPSTLDEPNRSSQSDQTTSTGARTLYADEKTLPSTPPDLDPFWPLTEDIR